MREDKVPPLFCVLLLWGSNDASGGTCLHKKVRMHMSVATNEKELGEALKQNENCIEIEGDLLKKVVRIKATGKVAWAVAFGATAVAVTAVLFMPATGGGSAPVAAASGIIAIPAAAAVLGPSVAAAAANIAVAAGGVAALNSLRTYRLEERNGRTFLVK